MSEKWDARFLGQAELVAGWSKDPSTKVGAVIGTIALGSTSRMAVYANRTLLLKEARPSWFLQLGVVCCGSFFLSLSVVVFLTFRG